MTLATWELIQSATTYSLLALIWVIQLVHYPSFAYVDRNKFEAFHAHHTLSISIVVMPLMLLELAAAAWLSWFQVGSEQLCQWFLLGLVLAIWASTFFLQVPLHQKLSNGPNEKAIQRLVKSNWIRTVLWSFKAGLVVFLSVKEGAI